MSNETKRGNGREQKGLVKTEVPIRVHPAKKKKWDLFSEFFRISRKFHHF